jgi:uncharacterized membrane protein YheB (UPF0754 family)
MNKNFFAYRFIPLNLRRFDEGDGAQAQAANQAGNESQNKDGENPQVNFTEEQTKEINRLIQQRVERERAKATRDAEKAAKEQEEAQRLASMTESEKAAQRIKALEDQLNQMTAAQQKNTMMDQVRATLREKNLSFDDTIVATLAKDTADDTKAAIDSFADAFQKAVEEAVKKQVNVTTPKTGAQADKGITKDEILKIKNRAERQKLIAEHLDLFK